MAKNQEPCTSDKRPLSVGISQAVAAPEDGVASRSQVAFEEVLHADVAKAYIEQPTHQHPERCSGVSPFTHPDKILTKGKEATVQSGASKAEYGVISLFDGVSTVVPTLQKKFGYPPTVIILAEIDTSLRALVCAEFGYRPDQTWGRTKHGSACLYVKDVNSLLEDHCRRLYEAVTIAPHAKWIIVGGSPCQDLTFAGAYTGMLGLVGKNSRLFFALLGTIRAMQDLVTNRNIRFLVENAGSMVDLHYQAFCELLGLPTEPKSQYLWDPADHGHGITRKRNVFRGHDDSQPIQGMYRLAPTQGGPLLLQPGKPITLPPLLRTRKLLPFEVCWSSWTLYQPCALIWDYDFWGGPEAFHSKIIIDKGKIPRVQWEDIIPPPFLMPWKKFLSLLQSSASGSQGFDETIQQLIPMFNGSQIRIPIRTLKEREVLQLSGLEGLWSNTSLDDAELLPEKVIRDYCGNSFHPDLIASALGSNPCLCDWVEGRAEGGSTKVADKNTFLRVYTHLCQEVEQLGAQQGAKFGTHLVKGFPHYPEPCDPQRCVPLPKVHDATLVGPRKPKHSKLERFDFNCNQAAVHHLGVTLSQTLRSHGLEVCFDAFRAPVTAAFQFEDYIRLLFGCYIDQLASSAAGQGPSLSTVSRIQVAFQRLTQHRTRVALLDCLIAAGCSNRESRWPVGHFVVFRESSQYQVYYLGGVQPKIILLVLEDQYGYPSIWMIGATAYSVPLQGGQAVCRIVDEASVRPRPDPETFVWLEHREGHRPGCLHQCGCVGCFLAQIRDFEYCPVHCVKQFNPSHLAHIVCEQRDTDTKLSVVGWIAPFSEFAKFWLFHVIPRDAISQVVGHADFTALPAEATILVPRPTCTSSVVQSCHADQVTPFHEGWPFRDLRHFLVRAGGDQRTFDSWLLARSQVSDND